MRDFIKTEFIRGMDLGLALALKLLLWNKYRKAPLKLPWATSLRGVLSTNLRILMFEGGFYFKRRTSGESHNN